MKRIFLWTGLVFLASCSGGPAAVLDGQDFLSKLEGPKVPTVADTMTESAKAAEAQGNFAKAAQIYQQMLQTKPENKDAQFGLADAMRRSGDFDRAIALYDDLIKKDAALIAAKEGKGLALMGKGDFESPTPLFEDVLKTDPKRWKTLNALGILFTTRNLHTEAQQYFKEALKHNPNGVSILNNLGLSQALDRQFEPAAASLLKASSLTGANSLERKRVDMNLALVYAIGGKLDAARDVTAQYYSGAALNNNMGLYAHLAKDDQLARSYLNMALTESKTFYEKAWDNLQSIDTNTSSSATPAKRVKVEEEKPKTKEDKPKTKKESARKKAPEKEIKDSTPVVPNPAELIVPVEKTGNVMPPAVPTPPPSSSENGLGAIIDGTKGD